MVETSEKCLVALTDECLAEKRVAKKVAWKV
jgi:hypothetical protein